MIAVLVGRRKRWRTAPDDVIACHSDHWIICIRYNRAGRGRFAR